MTETLLQDAPNVQPTSASENADWRRARRAKRHLLSVLPLDCHRLLADLKSAVINGEITKNGFGSE
jgi:hypothetical protein